MSILGIHFSSVDLYEESHTSTPTPIKRLPGSMQPRPESYLLCQMLVLDERSSNEATYDAHICCDKASQPDPEAKNQEANRPGERSQERAAHTRGERQRRQRDKRCDAEPEIEVEAALARVRRDDKSQSEDDETNRGREAKADRSATHCGPNE